MTINDLIEWHRGELRRLERSGNTSGDILARSATDIAVSVHWDAIKLLQWCVELPCVAPGQHSRAYAFERVLEEVASIGLATAAEIEEDGEDSDDEAHLDLRLWCGLSEKLAEQMWPIAEAQA